MTKEQELIAFVKECIKVFKDAGLGDEAETVELKLSYLKSKLNG